MCVSTAVSSAYQMLLTIISLMSFFESLSASLNTVSSQKEIICKRKVVIKGNFAWHFYLLLFCEKFFDQFLPTLSLDFRIFIIFNRDLVKRAFKEKRASRVLMPFPHSYWVLPITICRNTLRTWNIRLIRRYWWLLIF